MIRKCLSITLAALMVLAPFGVQPVAANSKAKREARRAEKVRGNINKIGVGEAARIAVKLRDKTKLTGHVSPINEDSLTITESETGKATVVPYLEVA